MPPGWLAVPTDFAQRILAALELVQHMDHEFRALASELRAAVERKGTP
jgi:hypothetical protein